MSGNNVLLDTSVVVRHFRDATSMASQIGAFEEFYLPQQALAELYAGAFRSQQTQKHLDQIERFMQSVDLLVPDKTTCESYGKIAAALARAGTPIPQNDIWIAALAIQCDLPLATTDAHFQRVEGLRVLKW
jgi:tRNA(fMet)-specific endonuclease VapC